MKKVIPLILGLLPLYWACSGNDETDSAKPENDVDAARMFIRSALDGKWKDARRLIVQDSLNIEDLETAERMAERRDAMTQRGYREAQITVHNTRKVNDSTTIVVYSNTFKKQQDSVKVVRVGNNWLVDLKYSFPHNNPIQQ